LTIPAETIKFILSDDKFATDKTIFGYVEIVTNLYYEDAYFFKNGYIKKRLRYKYYFKFKPILINISAGLDQHRFPTFGSAKR
jgi:hypothetical protein